tara:strand:+ start:89 stop:616 length:528 start_codon:yes stop_codon:yes gene_type:complete
VSRATAIAEEKSDRPAGRERLLLARKLAGSVKDQLYLAAYKLPVELRWEEEGDTQAELYLDQSGWFEGELRLHRGCSADGEIVWRGDRNGLKRALTEHAERLRRKRAEKRTSREALAERLRSIEQVARSALQDLEVQSIDTVGPARSEPVRSKLASIAAELEEVGDDLDEEIEAL